MPPPPPAAPSQPLSSDAPPHIINNRPFLSSIISSIDQDEYDHFFNPSRPSQQHLQQRRSPSFSSLRAAASDSDVERDQLPQPAELGYAMPPRATRKRPTATEAIDLSAEEADSEATQTTGEPSRKRRNTGRRREGAGAGASSTSRRRGEPIVIEDLDAEDDDDDEEEDEDEEQKKLKDLLQKQREEQVKAQEEASAPPRLNKLQCVICMDSFTDMTATSCGHIFCHECLISALKASETRRFQATGTQGKRSQCPVCRTTLNRTKKGDVIPLLIMKRSSGMHSKGEGIQARGEKVG